jgi:hypothetical protein
MPRAARPLSRFDRVGVIIVSLLGLCASFLAVATTGTKPTWAFAADLCKGPIAGLLLYAWDRLVNAVVERART